MKKAIICVAVIVYLLLVAYALSPTYYPLAQDADQIVAIEIVHVKDSRIIEAKYFDMITNIKTIPPEDCEAFLTRFKNLNCEESMSVYPVYIQGNAIRFTYQDDSFEIVGFTGGVYCTNKKDQSYSAFEFDYSQFNNLLNETIGSN